MIIATLHPQTLERSPNLPEYCLTFKPLFGFLNGKRIFCMVRLTVLVVDLGIEDDVGYIKSIDSNKPPYEVWSSVHEW
jgi:hypothetical protein